MDLDKLLLRPDTLSVHTLKVYAYNWASPTSWKEEQINAVLYVCTRYRVKKLFLARGDPFNVPSGLIVKLEKIGLANPNCYASDLRSIEVEDTGYAPVDWLTVLCMRTRVVDITWRSFLVMAHDRFDYVLAGLARNALLRISNVRKFEFLEWDEWPSNDFVPAKPKSLDYGILKAYLKRNKIIFKKCQKVTIILLGLKKRKDVHLFHLVDRDVLRIVIDMVWETRGTQVWIK